MQTLHVVIKDHEGLRILKDLEKAKIIRLVSEQTTEDKLPNLSQRLRGSISKETVADMICFLSLSTVSSFIQLHKPENESVFTRQHFKKRFNNC